VSVRITLKPLGTSFEIPENAPLHDHLFVHGVEFPCGGMGRCKGCRVRVVEGNLPVTPAQERMLTPEELRAGWRLACQCRAPSDLTLELAQWEAAILADETPFAFEPREGFGVAVDVGTTTLVAQILDLAQGKVLAVRSSLNPQARFGADIMSRIGVAVNNQGAPKLRDLIRNEIGGLVNELLTAAALAPENLREIVLVGNTVMHHLFCDISLEPLASSPFETPALDACVFTPPALGWNFPVSVSVRFLPCIGSFVGSDILAGVMATRLHTSEQLTALVDLGTNGEMVVGNRERMICASTAAGPAFEGARIGMGMRAATGAISAIHYDGSRPGMLTCHVVGNVAPRGLCGSGLVDAAACLLDAGSILPNGRMPSGDVVLQEPVRLSQTDIRELQLAKGAIAAGLRLLLAEFGARPQDVRRLYLAGAFGNYVSVASAQRIGLLKFPTAVIHPSGNTALLGCKMALFAPPESTTTVARRIKHFGLNDFPDFQDIYAEEMAFPRASEESR
jgi:uncharacterized 2Fe-2S/4Fe-4S cluster protein (DUF4445 family)